MADKIMRAPQASRKPAGSAKQVKSSIIEGPTASSGNLNPFNRSKKGK